MIRPTPADGAIVLFGGTNLDKWTSVDSENQAYALTPGNRRQYVQSGPFTPADRRPNWVIEDGVLNVGDKNIIARPSFGDCFLHIEFMVPYMPKETGQVRGNSGLFLQSWYEVQILDSYGIEHPATTDCGSIYRQCPPLVNVCKPPLEWQTYEAFFRGAHLDDSGNVTEHARITVMQNGIVVHNNAQLLGPTNSKMGGDFGPAPLMIQDHRDPVKFRNIGLSLCRQSRRASPKQKSLGRMNRRLSEFRA